MKTETFHLRPTLAMMSVVVSFCACGDSSTGGGDANCTLSYTTTTSACEMGLSDTTFGGARFAQSFRVSVDTSLTTASLSLYKTGTLSDLQTLTLSVFEDSSGKPATTASALGSASVQLGYVSATANYVKFTFSAAIALKGSTTYWLVLSTSYAQSATNYVLRTCHDDTLNGYTDGQAVYETGTSNDWQTAIIGTNRDFNFKIGC